jgi:hypothetical protein
LRKKACAKKKKYQLKHPRYLDVLRRVECMLPHTY